MKNTKSEKRKNKSIWSRIRIILVCVLSVLMLSSTAIVVIAETVSDPELSTREQTKARLMWQIQYQGWDPYSSNMTIDEFYALMELFDEGKLPLTSGSLNAPKRAPSRNILNDGTDGEEESKYIPRTMFLYAGLPDSFLSEAATEYPVLEYNNKNDYEPMLDSEGEQLTDNDGNKLYYYPAGLDQYSVGYKRPAEKWDGIKVDNNEMRVTVVEEGINDEDKTTTGNVIQGLFAEYREYYVRRVSIAGAEIHVLGMLQIPGTDKYVYYYLASDQQSTQVSTTTLPDTAKFVIEYVPIERKVDYAIMMAADFNTAELDTVIDNAQRSNSAGYVSTKVTDKEITIGSVFTNRPDRTADGAYAFDVVVPYGYKMNVYICIDMDKKVWFAQTPKNETEIPRTFPVRINHTGTYVNMKKTWLEAYYTYLKDNEFFDGNGRLFIGKDDSGNNKYSDSIKVNSYDDFVSKCIHQEGTDGIENIVLTWAVGDDVNKAAHDSMLVRMTERINDYVIHNPGKADEGWALGTYPEYSVKMDGFSVIPNTSNGPIAYTLTETFYNHLVKADRTIVAVLEKLENPTFDVSQILINSTGTSNRGSSASEEFAFKTIEKNEDGLDVFDEDYFFHKEKGNANNQPGDPLSHGSVYGNIVSGDSWSWSNDTNGFRSSAQAMRYDEELGTYYYTWIFQTNTGSQGFFLDAFGVNGMSVLIPFYPKYVFGTYSMGGKDGNKAADEDHPYYTEMTLQDGATFKLEFLLGWSNGGDNQRCYRVTVTGARSNVVITSLNLMQGTGAKEFIPYNLVGVYSDKDGGTQTQDAIEYYGKSAESDPDTIPKDWYRKTESNVVVDAISYPEGDGENHGANIRFKIADGYGSPYYIWADRHGDPIDGQTSATFNEDGSIKDINDVLQLKDLAENELLDTHHIYKGDDDYYYLRVTTQGDASFALLTVIAKTVRYAVRYIPSYDSEGIDKDSRQNEFTGIVDKPNNMPLFNHTAGNCVFADSDIGHEYDDGNGAYYDLLINKIISMPSGEYGGIQRPTDPNGRFLFENWVLVDSDYQPVLVDEAGKLVKIDSDGKYVFADGSFREPYGVHTINYLGGSFDVNDLKDYAVHRVTFSTDDLDIYVLRFMPYWKRIDNPFEYNVVLNWIDANGELHLINFSDYWDGVLTESPEDADSPLFVYLNKAALPLLNWIAQHPTYSFWNSVNNAVDDVGYFPGNGNGLFSANDKIQAALETYLYGTLKFESGSFDQDKYDEILAALTNLGKLNARSNNEAAFDRLGSDMFAVYENGATINIWMYENLGGVIIHKEVQGETFVPDDEFYFTISDLNFSGQDLNGIYRAYPEKVYDDNGLERRLTGLDAWDVTFERGKITSISRGGEKTTYFTVRNGGGIQIYLPAGASYTITELGSKSGGIYNVEVVASNNKDNLSDVEGTYLKGSKTESVELSGDAAQVSAKVIFKTGEIVNTVTFLNKNTALSIEKLLDALEENKQSDDITKKALEEYKDAVFTINLKIKLPIGENGEKNKPFYNQEKAYYYFSASFYDVEYLTSSETGLTYEVIKSHGMKDVIFEYDDSTDEWGTTLYLKSGERVVIVMPGDYSTVEYSVGEEEEVPGYVYKKEVTSEESEFEQPIYEYEYFTTREEAVKKHPNVPFKGESGFEDGVTTEWIEPATLDAMYITSMISPVSGKAQVGRKTVVEVVNWFGEPEGYGYLKITQKDGSSSHTFLFEIKSSKGETHIVAIKGGETAYVYLRCGSYTVKEISGWSWRYEEGSCTVTDPANTENETDPASGQIQIRIRIEHDSRKNALQATYTNTPNYKGWLGGESYWENNFTPNTPVGD